MDDLQTAFRFGGDTFDPVQDGKRLGRQLWRVREFMLRISPGWTTLADLGRILGAPEASLSARLRDLRRLGYVVERRRVAPGAGTYEYRALLPAEDES